MFHSIKQNDIVQLILKSRYVKVVGTLLFILTLAFAVQLYATFLNGDDSMDATGSNTITVHVGEMYFEQQGSEIPAGYLEAAVGDTIKFTNVGNLRHSVTVDELGFDEVINPGEETVLEVTQTLEDTRIHCRFHNGHEAVITVHASGNENNTFHTDHSGSIDRGVEPYEGDLPIRSAEDAVERLDYQEVDGVKEFELTAEHIVWEYADGVQLESWTFGGQIPGPQIRVTEGDQVRVIFKNELPVATTVHWHGVDVPNAMDGVPNVTQAAVEPGETFIYEFTADPAGTKFYHSHGSHHGDEHQQVDMGLSGPLVIEPADSPPIDKEFIMMLGERPEAGVYPINGKIFPEPEVLTVSEGDRVRVRMINASSSAIHPMHLHGHQFEVVAMDGNDVPVAAIQKRNTQPMMPGEIYDIEFTADNPGDWMFHCHELVHVAGGMVALLAYE
ncbi:MAG: multicopper oxidase domain-containing protein [Candidatus Saccharibacteria bacterium]|nr:multicopper oxidase domain-containing protein [Candidatus Saccharibacteria bacterium]